MAVKIRLQRRGRKKKPFYHIVVADERAPRDGKFIEKLGTYNPMTKPATIELDRDRTFDWLMKGAQPSDTARAILRFKGVMYRKHLQRGVKKGALTQEQADEMYGAWVTEKENKIRDRVNETAREKAEWKAHISGKAKPLPVKEVEVEAVEEGDAVAEVADDAGAAAEAVVEATEETAEAVTEAAEETAEVAEEAVEEAVEEVKEEVAEAAEETVEAVADETAEVAEAAEEVVEEAKEEVAEVAEAAEEVAEEAKEEGNESEETEEKE